MNHKKKDTFQKDEEYNFEQSMEEIMEKRLQKRKQRRLELRKQVERILNVDESEEDD